MNAIENLETGSKFLLLRKNITKAIDEKSKLNHSISP